MDRYKSNLIKEEHINIQTDRYYDNGKKVEVVKLIHIPTKEEMTVASYIGQISAYNIALQKLEERLKERS